MLSPVESWSSGGETKSLVAEGEEFCLTLDYSPEAGKPWIKPLAASPENSKSDSRESG